MKKIIISFLTIVFLVFSVQTVSASAKNVLIVLDASGSMLENFGSINRMEAAQSAITDVLAGFDSNIQTALRPYGHIRHAGNKDAACKETDLVVNFTTNHKSVSDAANKIEAVGGYTPTAYTLSEAKNDFATTGENTIILLSDGIETCDGDPASEAKKLFDSGIKTCVIGLGVDAEAKAQLQAVAKAGGCQYYDASDLNSLKAGLASIQKETGISKENTDTFVQIRGGNGFQSLVDIFPGEYQLDHHQRPDEYDYFKFTPKIGSIYKVSAQTSQRAVTYNSATDEFEIEKEYWTDPATDIYIYSPTRERVRSMAIQAWKSNTTASVYIMNKGNSRILIAKERRAVENDNGASEVSGQYLIFQIGLEDRPINKQSVYMIEEVFTPEYTAGSDTKTPNSDTGGTPETAPKNDASPEKETSNTLIYVVAGLIGLILILIILVLIFMRKSKNGNNIDTN